MDSFIVTHLVLIQYLVSHGQSAELSQASLHDSLYSRMILNCRRFTDATPRIRLVAARASGLVQIYTLARDDNGTWSIPSAPSEVEGVPTPLNSGMFVLDAHTGAPCKADKAHLTVAL